MNCISIALFPVRAQGSIKRVIEYFYPGKRGKIWTDIFLDNPSHERLDLFVLHAGSLLAQDATDDSWVREMPETDQCAGVLTKRIVQLHKEGHYFPIRIDRDVRSVWLDDEEYRVWQGELSRLIGDDPDADVPFTLWRINPIIPGKSVLRLCLEMREPTYKRRLGGGSSFFAHGEAIILRNIEDGDLPLYKGDDAERYVVEFERFKQAHKVPETFEYLIVSRDDQDLSCEAVTLSPFISPRFIRSSFLARTTRWFVTDTVCSDNWELKASFVFKIDLLDDQQPFFSASTISTTSQQGIPD
jgi:hypothetical protein